MQEGIEEQKAFERYATMGDISFELQEPVQQQWAINGQMLDMSVFRKLIFIIPVSVVQAGPYHIYMKYGDKNVGLKKEVTQTLKAGDNTVRIEFLSPEWRGYVSPKDVEGNIRVELSYLVSQKDMFDLLKSKVVGPVEGAIFQQFVKDEHLEQGGDPNRMINKFVGRKEIHF